MIFGNAPSSLSPCVEQPKIFFPRHPDGFHIVQDDRDRDFIVSWNHDRTFRSRVVEYQVIPALADEGASRFFKYSDLRLPVSGGYSLHGASRGGCIRKSDHDDHSHSLRKFGNYRTGIGILISSKHTIFLPVFMTSPSRVYPDSLRRSSRVPSFAVSSSWIVMTSAKFLRASSGV